MLLKTKRTSNNTLKAATSYEQWLDAARKYDKAHGLDRWQATDQSSLYDYASIRTRLDRLRAMRSRHDNRGLLFTLNEGIHGNMGGMGREALYSKAKSGTKKLVSAYVEEINDALIHIAELDENEISFEEKLDFFRRAHHCFGSSSLMLSGSGSLLFFHMGTTRVLLEHDLMPNVISGSSGGAIVGGLICTHTKEELLEFFTTEGIHSAVKTERSSLESFFQPDFINTEDIYETVERWIPDLTFEEAYELTGRHLNISIAPVETHQTSRLLNAVTSPNVFLREAIMASAAVPGVFPPVTLAAKNDHGERQAYLPSRQWVDGSISDDLPAKRLARLYGVNHYIVSQTNPLVLPFKLTRNTVSSPVSLMLDTGMSITKAMINASAEFMHKPISRNALLARVSNTVLSLINQDYVGDINMELQQKIVNPLRSLSRLNEEEINNLILNGQRAAWPKLEMIRVQTKIGRTLDSILTDFEERYISSAKQGAGKNSGQLQIASDNGPREAS